MAQDVLERLRAKGAEKDKVLWRATDGTWHPGVVRRPMSFQQYLELPDKPKAEWVDGMALIMMAPAAMPHSRISLRLAMLLNEAFPDLEVLQETGYQFGSSYRIPDIVMFGRDAQIDEKNIFLLSPPVLIVEILSPGTWREDFGPKSDGYLYSGVEHYWIVNYEHPTIIARTNVGDDWRVDAEINEINPVARISLGAYGTVVLDLNKLFRK